MNEQIKFFKNCGTFTNKIVNFISLLGHAKYWAAVLGQSILENFNVY